MSGKAPPRGPRALLASFPPTNPPSAPLQQQSQQQQPARNPLPSTSTRIGAAPPTGPRSLTNGIYSKPPPQGPKGLVNGQAGFFSTSQTSTGLPSHSLQNNRHPISIKGKKPENVSGWPTSGNWQTTSAQVNNRRESGAGSSDGLTSIGNIGVNGSRPAISISIPTGPSSTKTQALTRVNPPTQPAAMAQKSSDSLNQPAREPPPPPPSHSPPPPPPESPPAKPPSPTGPPSVQQTSLTTPFLPCQPSDPPPPPPEAPPPPPAPLGTPPSSSKPLQHDTRPPMANSSLNSEPASHPPPSALEPLPPPPFQLSASLPLTSSTPSCPPAELAATSPSSDPPPIPPSPPPLQPSTREPPLPLPPSEVLPHAPISFELTSHSKPRTSIAPAVSSSLLEGRSPTSRERYHSVSRPASPSQPNCQTGSTDQASEPQEPSKSESEPVFYSLPPLPEWPPPTSEYPSGRNFKVLYDPAVEGSLSSQALVQAKSGSNGQPLPLFYRSLIEHIRTNASSDVVQERIRGKAKGKEFLFRLEGKTFQVAGEGSLLEPEVVVRDPRKEEGFKRMTSQRPARTEFHLLKYEYDQNSVGSPPPTQVLVLNLPPLLHNQHIRQHFSNYGPLLGFEPQIDKENGSALGIVLLKYGTHEEAKKCVTKENGKKTSSIGVGLAAKTGEDDEIRVVLDGEGLKLKAVLKELDERKKKEKEEKRKKEKGQHPGASVASGSGSVLGKAGMSTPQTPMGQTPNSSTQWRGGQASQSSHARSALSQNAVASSSSSSSSRLTHPSLPQNPTLLADAIPAPTAESTRPSSPATVTANVVMPPMTHPLPAPPPPAARRPPASLVRARVDAIATPMAPYWSRRDRDHDRDRSRERSRDRSGDRSGGRSRDRDWDRGRRDRDRHWSRSRSWDRDWRDRSRGRDWRDRSRDTYWPDRDRDRRDRDRDRDRSRDRNRRDRSRDRDRRERSRERDWERERERDRGRRWSKERDRDTKCNCSSVSPSSKTEDRDRDRDHERERRRDSERFYQPTPIGVSRSPSPAAMMEKLGSGIKGGVEKEYEHDEVLRVLAKNGMEYVKVEGGVQLVKTVRGEEVKTFFEGFQVDQVLRDRQAIYVTFQKPDNARRAAMVLGSRTLAYQFVTLIVHSPPADVPEPSKTKWEEGELVEHAQQSIIRELRTLLEKDISDRVVAPMLRWLVAEEKAKSRGDAGAATLLEQKPVEKKGLKGLSFKKQPKKELVLESRTEMTAEAEKEEEEEEEEEGEEMEAEEVVERPRKRKKTESVKKARKIMEEEIESEEEDVLDPARFAAVEELIKKRAASEDRDEDDILPARKRQKREDNLVEKSKKSGRKKVAKKLRVDAVIPPDGWLPTPPEVAQIVVTPGSSLSRSPSPSPIVEPKRHVRVVTPPPTPPPDPFAEGLCEDDEDLFFAKLVLSGYRPSTPESDEEEESSPTDSLTFRKHTTGSARTEGFYKISHKEKAAYVAQYQSRTTTHAAAAAIEEPAPQPVISSRSNRANARRRAQGLEEINQVQRAVALSKGETAVSELTFKFNQLQTRKKHLRFARSPIHDWGLYAMEKISKGEMVIEYVGEVIRAQVADKREKAYERQGIGSSYLFRIDEDLVVDATKKGNLGRLINHSCDPNCTAKIITISGEKKIVIYAKQDIELGEEITYDYHFPFEQDKIPCLCGSAKCRGYLN